VEGLRTLIRRHVEWAQKFAGWVQEDKRFELAVLPPMNLVCLRHVRGDDVNQKIMDRLNQSGKVYLTHTKLKDRLTLRFCVGQTHTEERHVVRAWNLIQQAAEEVK
ncbi:MAG TPA: aspartate aminotransferase family protein, partial [Thermodesulfobacteriota bacterium]|nr:aspartate aminotransferase family protein [Thermodesulfobacteriota bacterium]